MISNLALWQNLQNYSLDAVDAAFPFSQRLARDNGWSQSYARAVIDEYRRFVYLTCISDHMLTPSDDVDQVWHLHLTYTRDYWDEFCPKILGHKLHHGPTKGGAEQTSTFKAAYEETLRLYGVEFDAAPPKAIWPDTAVRFTKPLSFRRIDHSSVYIIPKWQGIAGLGAATALLLGACKPPVLMEQVKIDGFWIWFGAIFVIAILTIANRAKRQSRRTQIRRRKDDGSGCASYIGCSSGDSDAGGSGCGGDSGCGSGCGGGD